MSICSFLLAVVIDMLHLASGDLLAQGDDFLPWVLLDRNTFLPFIVHLKADLQGVDQIRFLLREVFAALAGVSICMLVKVVADGHPDHFFPNV